MRNNYFENYIYKVAFIFLSINIYGCSDLSKSVRSVQGFSYLTYEEISKMTHHEFILSTRTGYLIQKDVINGIPYTVYCADKNCIADDTYFIFKGENSAPLVVSKEKLDDFNVDLRNKKVLIEAEYKKKEAEVLAEAKRIKAEREVVEAKKLDLLKKELDYYKNTPLISMNKKTDYLFGNFSTYYQITSSDDGPFILNKILINGRCFVEDGRIIRMGDYSNISEDICGKIIKIELYTNRGNFTYRALR